MTNYYMYMSIANILVMPILAKLSATLAMKLSLECILAIKNILLGY